jgi:TorA maturation chaperone TorD
MQTTRTLKNGEIFEMATNLIEAFQKDTESGEKTYPIKVLFYLRKNMKTLTELAQDIEKARVEIIKRYGAPSEENPEQYQFETQEKIDAANKEFEELFGLEQEVTIYTIPLEAFNDMELTEKQMDAVIEMIEE